MALDQLRIFKGKHNLMYNFKAHKKLLNFANLIYELCFTAKKHVDNLTIRRTLFSEIL